MSGRDTVSDTDSCQVVVAGHVQLGRSRHRGPGEVRRRRACGEIDTEMARFPLDGERCLTPFCARPRAHRRTAILRDSTGHVGSCQVRGRARPYGADVRVCDRAPHGGDRAGGPPHRRPPPERGRARRAAGISKPDTPARRSACWSSPVPVDVRRGKSGGIFVLYRSGPVRRDLRRGQARGGGRDRRPARAPCPGARRGAGGDAGRDGSRPRRAGAHRRPARATPGRAPERDARPTRCSTARWCAAAGTRRSRRRCAASDAAWRRSGTRTAVASPTTARRSTYTVVRSPPCEVTTRTGSTRCSTSTSGCSRPSSRGGSAGWWSAPVRARGHCRIA